MPEPTLQHNVIEQIDAAMKARGQVAMAHWKKATHPGAYRRHTRKKMPKQKPGQSKQDYQTPRVLLDAVRHYLDIWPGDYWIDLAANQKTRVVSNYIGRRQNSLSPDVSWVHHRAITDRRWAWLNPPFAQIEPWVRKAHEESQRGARIAMLVPAAVGANWWVRWVHEKAHVLLLNGRVTFVGTTQGYPKDCVILLYGLNADDAIRYGFAGRWYLPWRWTEQK